MIQTNVQCSPVETAVRKRRNTCLDGLVTEGCLARLANTQLASGRNESMRHHNDEHFTTRRSYFDVVGTYTELPSRMNS